MDDFFESSGLRLSCHVSEPPTVGATSPAVILCHGFPVRGRESPASGKSFPELADRIANEMGWLAMAMVSFSRGSQPASGVSGTPLASSSALNRSKRFENVFLLCRYA